MLKSGLYKAEDTERVLDSYEITMRVKETEKAYIFDLVDFNTQYGATQMEDFFRKSKHKVLRKDAGGHAMRIWSDKDFTFYPYQVGVPYYFVFQE